MKPSTKSAATPLSSTSKKRMKRKHSSLKKNHSSNWETIDNDENYLETQIVGKRLLSNLNYPYPTDYNDHFETPLRAYSDIMPSLQCVVMQRTHSKCNVSNELTIYDPYFCTGRASLLLEQAFEEYTKSKKLDTQIKIQHEKRDFYEDLRQSKIPQHDILVTNPPYSGNHKERCLEFAVSQLKNFGRPFFLLMPNYVATKDYFRKIVLDEKVLTLFISPCNGRPYEYQHPEGTGHDVPPFDSIWYCGFNRRSKNESVSSWIKVIRDELNKSQIKDMPKIVASLQELVHTGCVSGAKRKNPRQRKKIRLQMMHRENYQIHRSSFETAELSKKNEKSNRQNEKRRKKKHFKSSTESNK